MRDRFQLRRALLKQLWADTEIRKGRDPQAVTRDLRKRDFWRKKSGELHEILSRWRGGGWGEIGGGMGECGRFFQEKGLTGRKRRLYLPIEKGKGSVEAVMNMTEERDQPKLLTIREVASLLRCSVEVVRGLIKRDEISAIKVGWQWRIFEKSVREDILKMSGEGSV